MDDRRQEIRREDDQPFPWQTLANLLFAALIALGGYVWTENARQVRELQVDAIAKAQQIVRLEERRDAQERLIGELQGQLRRMEDKLDKALDERRSGGSGLTGRMFDK